MTVFSAIGLLRWIQTQKRNPLNRCHFINGRLISFRFSTEHPQLYEGVGNY